MNNRGGERRKPADIEAEVRKIWNDLMVSWDELLPYFANHIYYNRKEAWNIDSPFSVARAANLTVIEIFIKDTGVYQQFSRCCDKYGRELVLEKMKKKIKEAADEKLIKELKMKQATTAEELEGCFSLLWSHSPANQITRTR